MSLALALAAAIVLVAFFFARSKKQKAEVARDSTPAIDAWIADKLEMELAEGALGLKGSTADERRGLAKSLRGEPDPEVVSKIEDAVNGVELEWVKYAHENEAELTLRVKYQGGKIGSATKRIPLADAPEAVRTDFERRATSHVFRTWAFPWQRATML